MTHKHLFFLLAVLLSMAVGVTMTSCGDDEDGTLAMLQGMWKWQTNEDDAYPYWEFKSNQLKMYNRDWELQEKYTYTYDSSKKRLRCQDVRFAENLYNVYILSISDNTLVLRWEYDDGYEIVKLIKI